MDAAVFTAVFQGLEPFAELGQQRFAALGRRETVFRCEQRFFTRFQVGPAVFVDQKKRRHSRDQCAIMPAPDEFAQGLFLVGHPGQLVFQPLFQGEFMQNITAFDHDVFSRKGLDRLRRRGLAFSDHRYVMAHGMCRSEIEIQVAAGRVKHALHHIDFSGFQGGFPFRPSAKPDLDFQARLPGDGAGQIHVVAHRMAVFIQELIGREIPVAADHNRPVRRQLHGGEPLGVQMAIGAVRYDDRQSFIEQGQGVAVALPDGEGKSLLKTFNGMVDHPQIGQAGFLNQAQRHQPLDHHRVIPSL